MIGAIQTGTVWVNTYRRYDGFPLEGMKDSGYGHDGVAENTREKAVLIDG